MAPMPPYARLLGIDLVEDGGVMLYRMPFGDIVLGRPGYLHGGAIAGLLEIAAIGTLRAALEEADLVKPINMSLSYMRGGTDRDTYAAATVTRLGSRVANVEAHAWQGDRDKPIAAAQLNLLVKRG